MEAPCKAVLYPPDLRLFIFLPDTFIRQCHCQCAPRQAVLYQRSNRLVVESHKTLSKLTKTKTNVHTRQYDKNDKDSRHT